MTGPGRDVRADSAGVPWAGRDLPSAPFSGDDGAASPALTAALAGGRLVEVAAAVAAARLLVPVVAVVAHGLPAADAARGDLGADMAIMILTGADGRRALPVFSAAGTLARWDRAARPVPVEAARAALAAVAEGCDRMVLDPAGPLPCELPGPVLVALARGREWVPPAQDAELRTGLAALLMPVPEVCGVRLAPHPQHEDLGVRLILQLRAGLDQGGLTATLDAVRARLAGSDLLAERVTAVELKVVPARPD